QLLAAIVSAQLKSHFIAGTEHEARVYRNPLPLPLLVRMRRFQPNRTSTDSELKISVFAQGQPIRSVKVNGYRPGIASLLDFEVILQPPIRSVIHQVDPGIDFL